MDWLFQCNPKRWDLASILETDPVQQDEWSVGQGRNLVSPDDRVFFWQTGQDARLLAIGHELVSISSKPKSDASQRDLDAAIKRVRQQTANELRNHISRMDYTAFEWLVRALLLKLGYTNVEVTKHSGDGGVDVRALLVASGVANIQTCIQAKRQQSVGRPVVQNLRGSLSAHEAGLLVTSGNFSREAIEEAKEPNLGADRPHRWP